MIRLKMLAPLLLLIVLPACSSLTPHEERVYMEMSRDGHRVEEKDPVLGAFLGLLPGVGSFYTGQIGWGVFDLLLWPYSMIWDPFIGYENSQWRNFQATKAKIRRQRKNELEELDRQLLSEAIDQKEYARKRIQVNRRYDYDYE